MAGAELLILVTDGRGVAEVDFRQVSCRPGTLLWVHTGQVLRCVGHPFDGLVLRWYAEAPERYVAAPRQWHLRGADGEAVREAFHRVTADRQRFPGPEAADLLRYQLAALVARLALSSTDEPSAPGGERGTFHRLRQEVERDYRQTRRVEDYATRIGCSVRTLTRACLAVTGRSAKQVIDERVALEASRLLAATDEPIAQIGRRLGFPEPTNFGRFFTREVGRSPGAFRADREQWPAGGDQRAPDRESGGVPRDQRPAPSAVRTPPGQRRSAVPEQRTVAGEQPSSDVAQPGTANGRHATSTEVPNRLVRPRPPAGRTDEPDRA
ncbi:AraC family transcriptional regulator [Micromonospora sp. SH-82]